MKDILKSILIGFISIVAFLIFLNFVATTVYFIDEFMTNNPEFFPYLFGLIVALVSYFVGSVIRD